MHVGRATLQDRWAQLVIGGDMLERLVKICAKIVMQDECQPALAQQTAVLAVQIMGNKQIRFELHLCQRG